MDYYHFLQENYVRKLCMVLFLLSFVKGPKSAEGGTNPLADMDPGGPASGYAPGGWSISASGFGPGGPNSLGHRHKRQVKNALKMR